MKSTGKPKGSSLLFQSIIEKAYSGGFGPGVPPLPIPNREVKPGRADGTAPQCGRVGRRLLERSSMQQCVGLLFLCLFVGKDLEYL